MLRIVFEIFFQVIAPLLGLTILKYLYWFSVHFKYLETILLHCLSSPYKAELHMSVKTNYSDEMGKLVLNDLGINNLIYHWL